MIEVGINVKNDELKGDIVLIENLPESIKVIDYRVKNKRGKQFIQSVNPEIKNKNGKKYYQFNIVPKNGSFRKSSKVWIFMDVVITPSKNDYSESSSN